MSKKLSETEKLTLNVYSALTNLLVDEENQDAIQKIDIEKVDANNLFTAILLAYKTLFEELTSSDIDLIDFTHILNKLAVQYILGDKTDESEEE